MNISISDNIPFLLSVIGPENFRFSLNQSDAKLTKISTWLPAIFWLIYAVCLSVL